MIRVFSLARKIDLTFREFLNRMKMGASAHGSGKHSKQKVTAVTTPSALTLKTRENVKMKVER